MTDQELNGFSQGSELEDRSLLDDCWNQIGVMGDRTCSKLPTVIHCHECPVYAAVGDSLLERAPMPDYLQEWIGILAETPNPEDLTENYEAIRTPDALSAIIFQIGKEHLALPVRMLQEVTHPCVIQPLPHRSNELFLGLVNIRGEILLCASLHHLLNIQSEIPTVTTSNPMRLERMIVAGLGADKWVFPVDEVRGIYRFHSHELREAPIVITKAAEAYTKGIIYWQGYKVSYLDSELLFYALNQKIL